MADRQLKLPLNAKPVTRIVPPRLDGAKRPMLGPGNNGTLGAAAVRPPALAVQAISGAPRPQSDSK